MTIDRSSYEPPYAQLARILRQAIDRGDYGPGDRLPSETTLQQQYELGRDAVRDAMQMLRMEGVVVTVGGSGSYVRGNAEMERVLLPPDAEVMSRMPTADERRELGVGVGVPVFVVTAGDESRIYLADRTMLVTSEE